MAGLGRMTISPFRETDDSKRLPNDERIACLGATGIKPGQWSSMTRLGSSRTSLEGMTGPSWHPPQSHLRNEGTTGALG